MAGEDAEDEAGFSVDLWLSAGRAVVRVEGDLDIGTAAVLWGTVSPLARRPPRELVVDLAGTTFMDAAGLGVLVRAANLLRPTGCRVVLRSPQPIVRRLLDAADVGVVLPVDGDGSDR